MSPKRRTGVATTRAAAGRGGFSLLEIIVAAVVLATAMVVIVEGVSSGLSASSRMTRQSTAHRLAADRLRRLEALDAPALPDRGERAIRGVTYVWQAEHASAPAPAGLRRVVCTVWWPRRGEHRVSVEALWPEGGSP